MNGIVEDLDSLLDSIEFDEFEERARRPGLRTPSRQPSFAPRPASQIASQTQVQSAARNLDAKIETLSTAVKALETRVNGVAADTQRIGVALRKETDERKKGNEVIRADLQQTKVLGALLPLIAQETVELKEADGEGTVKVLAPSSNQLASFLPIFLLMGSGGGGDASKGGFGDMLPLLIGVSLIGKKS